MMQKTILTITLLFFTIICKIIPHTPNFTPQLVLMVVLGAQFNKNAACLAALLLSLLLDGLSSYFSAYSMLGSWTLFTYSAYVLLAFSANFLKISTENYSLLAMGAASSLLFWLWTNLGTWLFSGMYALTATGLLQCYILALPFLTYSILASLFWSGLVIAMSQKHLLAAIDYSAKLH